MSSLQIKIPGEKLLIKIWDSLIDQGIGGLLLPWQIKRTGKARAEVRRYEILVMTQTEGDLKDIQAGVKALDENWRIVGLPAPPVEEQQPALPTHTSETSAVPPSHEDNEAFLKSVRQQVTVQEIKRALNLRRMVILAEEEAEHVDDADVSDQAVDPDWVARWRNDAQDVSSEELQRLWSRVLAGEMKQPGSYALRTLDFMRNLSKEDAKKIEVVAAYRIFNCIPKIRGSTGSFSDNVPLKLVLELEEMGVLQIGGGLPGLEVTFGSTQSDRYKRALVCNGKVLLVTGDKPDAELALNAIVVTRIGRELMSLGTFSPDLEYLRKVGEIIKGKGYQVKLGDVGKTFSDGTYEVRNLNPI